MFALVALATFFLGQWQLESVPGDVPLIVTMYLLGMIVAGSVGAASARWYLESEFPAVVIIISPVLPLMVMVIIFGLLFPGLGLGGPFLLIAVAPWPVLLGGGLMVSFLMYRRYRK